MSPTRLQRRPQLCTSRPQDGKGIARPVHKFIAKCEHADGTEVSWKRPTNLQEPENVEYRILTEKRSERTMLNFPNQSRVFDPTRRAVLPCPIDRGPTSWFRRATRCGSGRLTCWWSAMGCYRCQPRPEEEVSNAATQKIRAPWNGESQRALSPGTRVQFRGA